MQLKVGLKGIITHRVVQDDLATNWRNDVPVLATPVLFWLAELACMNAIDDCTAEGEMTVGYRHEMKHLAPTPKGWLVQITAELVRIEGKMLTFKITANDGEEKILGGFHTRAVIRRQPFIERVSRKELSVSLTP